MAIPKKILLRQDQITEDFLKEIDKHLSDILEGKAERMYEIRDIADILNIHPTHLSNTIKLVTHKSACDLFEDKILSIAKGLLEKPEFSVSEIAVRLTYDPSNFTKFFKKYTGKTPTEYRNDFFSENSETVTK